MMSLSLPWYHLSTYRDITFRKRKQSTLNITSPTFVPTSDWSFDAPRMAKCGEDMIVSWVFEMDGV